MTPDAPLADVPLDPALLRGALEVERTDRGLLPLRLPRWVTDQVGDPQLTLSASQPSGVRLALRTAATTLELDVVPTKRSYVGAPPRPDGVHELVVDGRLVAHASVTGGDTVRIDMTTGTHTHERGPRAPCGSPTCRPARRTWSSGSPTTRRPCSSRCAPTRPWPRRRPVAGAPGCTTAARSARARTRRPRPAPGRPSPPAPPGRAGQRRPRRGRDGRPGHGPRAA